MNMITKQRQHVPLDLGDRGFERIGGGGESRGQDGLQFRPLWRPDRAQRSAFKRPVSRPETRDTLSDDSLPCFYLQFQCSVYPENMPTPPYWQRIQPNEDEYLDLN
jgi:hypothetical protein